jgi:peptide deformylase
MIFPIVAYGHPVLRKVAQDIGPDYPGLKEFIDDMFETMYKSDGVGLAAPQVNRSIRLFVIDASHFAEQQPELNGFKKAFINAHITEESGEEWIFNEGCLSVPEIREDVSRKPRIRIEYDDENFVHHDEFYEGIAARIIQHEYDHLDGIMLVDRISPLRKMLLKRKLNDISTGNIDVSYKMIFPGKKGKVKV